jgi:O-antigen/teichoic acid export membrane protein
VAEFAQAPERVGQSTRRGVFGASLFVLIANVCAGLFAVGTQIITARILGPAGRGEYVLITLVAVLGVTFGALGIPAATVYFRAGRHFPRKTIVAGNLFLSLLIGGLILVVGSVTVLLAPDDWFHAPRLLIVVALASIPFFLITSNLQAVFQGDHDFKTMNVLSIMQTALPFVFTALALLIFDVGLRGAVIAYAGGAVGTALVALARAARRGEGIGIGPSRAYTKHVLKYGLQAQLAYLAIFLIYRVDTLLVAGLAGSSAVGYYSVAVVIAERVWLLSFATSIVLLPRIASETSEAVRQAMTARATRSTFWLSASIALALLLGGHELIALLFSSSYNRSVAALDGLLIGIVALSASRILANDLAARGHPILNAYVGYASLAANVGANLILIPRFGIAGAAWSSSISYTLSLVLTIMIYCKQTRSSSWALFSPALLLRDVFHRAASVAGSSEAR